MSELPSNDERVTRLKTPEECEQFAINVQNRLPLHALAAKRRAVELKASQYGTSSQVEQEAIAAVYAYERILSDKAGKKIYASRTWQMIKRHGIVEAIERVVKRKDETTGFQALVDVGLEDYAFEAVVLRHSENFSQEAINSSKQRLDID